ncbi:MAG: response regulator [Anaerolineaceae bacterium]|nr:MAG: response regulator [Anaerolineaceae bacterium]
MTTVMIVDNDHTTIKLLSQLLELEGFDVILAEDPEGAMQAARANPSLDVVLIDYHLSDDVKGTQIIEQLRREGFADLPIVVMSGMNVESESLASGADHFLAKPFEPNDLPVILRQAIGE